MDQWRPLLRKRVDSLVLGLKITDALDNVYHAENHSRLLQNHAHSLYRCVCMCVGGGGTGSMFVCFCYVSNKTNCSPSAPCHRRLTCLRTAAGWLSLMMMSQSESTPPRGRPRSPFSLPHLLWIWYFTFSGVHLHFYPGELGEFAYIHTWHLLVCVCFRPANQSRRCQRRVCPHWMSPQQF